MRLGKGAKAYEAFTLDDFSGTENFGIDAAQDEVFCHIYEVIV